MSHNPGPNQTIAEIYRGVIADVVTQVKESFLDEGVDIEILQQLRKEWEEKVRESGAVDYDGPRQPVQAPPPLRQPMARPVPVPVPQGVRIQPSTQQFQPTLASKPNAVGWNRPPAVNMNLQQQHLMGHHMDNHGHHNVPQQRPPQQTMQFIGQPTQMQQFQAIQVQGGVSGVNFAHALPQGAVGVRMITAPNGQPQLVMQQPSGMPLQQQQVMILGGQPHQFISTNGMVPQRVILQQQPMQDSHPIHQLDGGHAEQDDNSGSPTSEPCSSTNEVPSLSTLPKPKRVKGKELKELLKRFKDVIQLDGNGMSDSSSEDEVEEDDDPLRRIAQRIGGDGHLEDEEEQLNEEAPLGSDDDQSDDEDLNTLFDADNVVMCQFEKVSRARQKWKFSLKDGIMHIDGKDFCFQKCSGEAEW